MQHPASPPTVAAPDQAEHHTPDLAALQASLLRYARARQRNITLAEDAVSETLLAAWQAQVAFSSQIQATAWVYGILRHKLVDQMRQQGREVPAGDQLPEPGTRSPEWFVGGAWCGMTSLPTEPEHACSQRQFLDLVLRCCDQLPPGQRQAFLLRELFDDEPASICSRLGVSEGNLWVLVHRARVRLRALLREQWLEPDDEAPKDAKARRPRRSTAAGSHAGPLNGQAAAPGGVARPVVADSMRKRVPRSVKLASAART